MKKISYEKFLKIKKDEKIVIYDIRNYDEYKKFHIENSIHIDEYYLKKNYEKILSKNITYYLICTTGHNSYKMTSFLQKHNYSVYSIKHGYKKIN